MKDKTVLVLMGGESTEREISLKTGQAVYKALQEKGYSVASLDVNSKAAAAIQDISPDVVFIALHGKKGEDGTIQGMLDIMGIPYTGSGVACSAICMNKVLTKKILSCEGIPTPPYTILKRWEYTDPQKTARDLTDRMGLPLVIKASTQGSSIGTFIVKQADQIIPAMEDAFRYDTEIIAEKYIAGVELTAAVIGNDQPQVLPIIEITAENEFYDYQAKYTPGKCAHIIPARIDSEIKNKVNELAQKTYITMGCRGFARIDFMVDRYGNPFVLEINTIPGMTEMSLVPDAARAAGINFNDLVGMVVDFALE
ncbi:MAG TPA: D-alanine--D-alanine ligase [Syntrophomonadaceae bacterium]|nr:D-alanine--D-alanine ligase [Syntrophomonadaceae bacterium]